MGKTPKKPRVPLRALPLPYSITREKFVNHPDSIRKIARLARILSHETRLLIAASLLDEEKRLGEIAEWTQKPYHSVMQHLIVLARAGLVDTCGRRKFRRYRLRNIHFTREIITLGKGRKQDSDQRP